MFLQLDGTFWVQLINFAIFYAIVRVVFLNPVGKAIAERRAYIDGVQSDYVQYTSAVKALRAEAEAKRAAARREAEELVSKARAAANEEAQRVAAEYAEKASAIANQARATVESELAAARQREPELAATLGDELLQRALEALAR
jgi:F0F1-type ATP synthase membrane subunit b/b'